MGACNRAAAILGLGCLSLVPIPSAGAEGDSPAPAVPLERLLEIPTSVELQSEVAVRGGDTRAEWRARFEQAERNLVEAREALEAVLKELEEAAPDQAWTMGAPGLGAQQSSESSIDFRLRQEIRQQRENVERAERAQTELRIEADLAGVPPDWQGAR